MFFLDLHCLLISSPLNCHFHPFGVVIEGGEVVDDDWDGKGHDEDPRYASSDGYTHANASVG